MKQIINGLRYDTQKAKERAQSIQDNLESEPQEVFRAIVEAVRFAKEDEGFPAGDLNETHLYDLMLYWHHKALVHFYELGVEDADRLKIEAMEKRQADRKKTVLEGED